MYQRRRTPRPSRAGGWGRRDRVRGRAAGAHVLV